VPDAVIARAKEILRNLEKGELDEAGMPKIARGRKTERKNANQLSLFTGEGDAILEEIRGLDPLRLTPLDALQRLIDWKAKLE
jgi:DNA mismatch repair protein MutS